MVRRKVVFRMEIPLNWHYHSALTETRTSSGTQIDNRLIMNMHTNYRRSVVLLAACLAFASGTANAQGDPQAGRELGFTCLGCHGIEGQRNAYPSFRVPRLAGQKSEYLESALNAYRAGTRPHPTMQAQAGSLSDDDVDNLIAWLSSYAEVADTATAEQVASAQVAQICVTCHGVDGAAVEPAPPTLAGQHEDYLVYAMQQYKDGSRSGNVMSAFVATLTEADIKMLADFYASQDGVETLPQ